MTCISGGLGIPDDEMAGRAAVALAHDRPMEAVDLALLNGLHGEQNIGHSLFRLLLRGPYSERPDTPTAIRRFYEATIMAHERRGQAIGEIRYSYANFLRYHGSGHETLRAFNGARRDEPDY